MGEVKLADLLKDCEVYGIRTLLITWKLIIIIFHENRLFCVLWAACCWCDNQCSSKLV
jgi:hypothetical protein